jgi:hypothetical protein
VGKTVEISGGDKLQKKLEEIAKGLASGSLVRVGFLEGATHTHSDLPMAAIAAIQEFGAPAAGIPPRPFFRNMVAEYSGDWGEQLAGQLTEHDYNAFRALNMMGLALQGELRQSMTDLDNPPLSPVTLMLRKMQMAPENRVITGKVVGEAAARVAAGESPGGVSTKPLIWTGELQSAVEFEVHE